MSVRRVALIALALSFMTAVALPAAAQRRDRGPDANGDAKISLQDFLAQRGRIFERMDANHDGQVTKDEVAAFSARMEAAAAGATIRSGRERSGGGEREIARFEEMTAQGPVTRAQWDAMMTRRFQRMDTAHTGYITRDQMRARRDVGDSAAPVAAPPAKAPMGAPSAMPQ